MIWLWLLLAVVLVIIEATTPQLITIWFAVGSLGGLAAASFGFNIWIQIIVFTAFSLLLLVFTRPFLKNVLKQKSEPTNADRLIGTVAIVEEEIDNDNATGSVRASGQFWSARSTTGKIISVGTKVKVDEINGVKLLVTETDQLS